MNTVKHNIVINKGESGIRTHGTRKDSSDFKSDAIDQLCHLAKRLVLELILKYKLTFVSSSSTKFN